MPSASTVAELAVVVTADTTGVDKGLGDLDSKVKGIGGTLSTAFAGAAVAGVAALGGALAVSVKSAADFESQMSAVTAVMDKSELAAAGGEEALTQLALTLGKETSFSAKEAAAGMEELAKAGVSVSDMVGGAAKASLDLAAAGAIDVADAAEIASNAMNVFGVEGSQMGHVADVIAGAANASAISVTDYKFSLSAAGAVAATVGVGFEDLSTAIAAMGNAGIKGSDAGTSLKTMLMNLIPSTNKQKDLFRELGIITFDVQRGLEGAAKKGLVPATQDLAGLSAAMMDSLGLSRDTATWTKKQQEQYEELSSAIGLSSNAFFDASGKAKGMADIAQVLQDALAGMTQEQKLATLETMFGSDAIRAAAVLSKEGAAGMEELAASIGKVTAAQVAEERLDNLNGSIEKLMGSLETIAITIGLEMLPVLKDMVDMLTEAANEAMPQIEASAKSFGAALREWMPVLKDVVSFLWENRDAIMAVVAALATFAILTTVIGWVTAIAGAIGAVTAAISASGGVLAALGALVALLGGPVTLVIAAIALAVGALAYAWANDWGGIQEKTAAVVDFLSGIPATIEGYWNDISTATDGLVTAVSDAWNEIKATTETIWNGIKTFLTDWWRTIVVVLGGPVGALAVLIIDNWESIKTATETIWQAIQNVLSAVWTAIYQTIIEPQVRLVQLTIEACWEAIRAYVDEKMTAVKTILQTAWDAITTAATTALNALLTFVTDTIFEPIRAAVAEKIEAARLAVATALDSIKAYAESVLNPFLSWWRDTIWTPISTTVITAMDAAKTAFDTAVNGFKTAVDQTMGGVKSAWESTWSAIQHAAESPKAAMDTLIGLVEKLKNIMPDWLIPHSPTPFQVGLEGIIAAAKKMDRSFRSIGDVIGDANGEVSSYIAQTAAALGIDPLVALRIAEHEGGADSKMRVGKFDTGWSFWPFQLHYGGKGYEHFGTTAGMGNDFTAKTGWQPGDVDAWKDSIDFALKYAARHGWSAWYGRGPAGVGAWEGIPGHADGAIAWKPHLAWVGEKEPEAIIPKSWFGGSGGGMETVRVDVAIGGRVAEQIYVTGRDLAIRRGRGSATLGTVA